MCLVFWYYWIEEVGDIDFFFLQFVGKVLCYYCFVQYYWNDGVVGVGQCEVCCGYFFVEQMCVSLQVIVQVCFFFNYFQYFDGGGYDGWCQRVGEQIWMGVLVQLFNYFFVCGGVVVGGVVQCFI